MIDCSVVFMLAVCTVVALIINKLVSNVCRSH